MKQIAEIIKQIEIDAPGTIAQQGGYNIETEEKPTRRKITPLEEFTTHHLKNEKERQNMQDIISSAKEWIGARPLNWGLSFGISGAVGTGKTTIARNLMNSAIISYKVLDRTLETYLESLTLVAGKFVTATELMGIMDPGRNLRFGGELVGKSQLSDILRDIDIIVIDDVGTEEISFKSSADAVIARRNRYGEFMDYCYDNKISVVITSMIPIVQIKKKRKGNKTVIDKQINPEFLSVMGQKAFDRFWERARNYTFTLPEGFPSYRREK